MEDVIEKRNEHKGNWTGFQDSVLTITHFHDFRWIVMSCWNFVENDAIQIAQNTRKCY